MADETQSQYTFSGPDESQPTPTQDQPTQNHQGVSQSPDSENVNNLKAVATDNPQYTFSGPEPTFAGRAAETSGASAIIGLVSAEAKHRVDMFHHAIDSVRKGDYKQAGYAAYGALSGGDKDDPLAEAAKEIVLQPWEELKKAKKEAEKIGKANSSGEPNFAAGEVLHHAVGAVPIVGAAGEAVGEPIAEDLKNHNWSALAGDIVGAGLTFGIGAAIDHFGKIKAGAHAEPPKTMYHVRDVGTKDIPATSQGYPSFKTAVDKLKSASKTAAKNTTVPNQPSVPQEVVAFDLNKAAQDATYQQTKVVPESLVYRITTQPATIGETVPAATKDAQAVGNNIQASVESTRSTLGGELGAAKEGVQESLPHGVFGEEGSFPLASDGEAAKFAQKQFAKSWVDKDVKPWFDKYANPVDSEGNPVRMDFNDFEQELNHISQKIEELDNLKNGTKAGQLRKLRSAISNDRYNLFKEYGDPVKVANAKSLSTQYGKLINDIEDGPAKELLSSNSPSSIIQTLVGKGAKGQDAIESIMSHLDEGVYGKKAFSDDYLYEFYNHAKNNMMKMSDGTMGYDAGNLAKNFRHLRGAAEAALGRTRVNQLQELYDTTAKLQVENSMKATRAAQKSKLIKKGVAKIGGAAAGGSMGGAAGAIVGAVAGHEIEGILNIGRDGIIKVGISPDEVITLAPQELSNPGRMAQVVKFAKAAASGSQNLMRVSYNNIVSPAIKMAATGGKAGMVVEGSKKDKLNSVMSGAANALGGSAKEAP